MGDMWGHTSVIPILRRVSRRTVYVGGQLGLCRDFHASLGCIARDPVSKTKQQTN